MEHVVVTGSNRGLGLEFVRQELAEGHQVAAWTRHAEAPALRALADEHGDDLRVQPCSVDDEASVRAAARSLAGSWQRIDLLVCNAGTSGRTGDRLPDLDFADAAHAYEVNALGPLRVVQATLPLLRAAEHPRIALITSRMGSLGDNGSGGWWAYRMSKAALNMAGVNLAHELDPLGVTTLILHPGWVRTDMGGDQAPLSPEDSVRGLRRVLATRGSGDSGGFFDHQGERLPW